MAKIRKSKIYWKPSNSHHLASYKLYWAVGGNVNYDSEHADVGLRTEIILPDDVPSFPFVDGDIEIGITAVTDRGSESDMVKMSASFDFALPGAPSEIESQDMEDFFSVVQLIQVPSIQRSKNLSRKNGRKKSLIQTGVNEIPPQLLPKRGNDAYNL